MLKHQKLFLAMEQRIDSGEDLIGNLNASLESLEQANNWMDRLENGDHTAVAEVIRVYPVENISMEGVQVHVNSNQVQAVIDFLKKWIPIVLKKIKDLATRFYRWVVEKLNQLGEKIAGLKKKVSASTETTYSVETKGTDAGPAAIELLSASPTDIGDTKGLHSMYSWCALVAERAISNDESESLPPWREFRAGAAEWLTLDSESSHFSEVFDGETPEDLITALFHLPAPNTVARELKAQLASTAKTSFSLSKAEVLQRLDQLNRLQLQLAGKVRATQRDVDNLQAKIERFERSAVGGSSTLSKWNSEAMKLVVKATSYTVQAGSAGLQERLRVIGLAVSVISGPVD